MPLEVKFEDDELEGFSDPAKARLKTSVRDLGVKLIAEANRLEASHNTSNGSREVTHSMVDAATTLMNHGISPRRRSAKKIIIRSLSQGLPLLLGLLLDPKRFTDLYYVAFVLVIFGAAIVCIIFSNLED